MQKFKLERLESGFVCFVLFIIFLLTFSLPAFAEDFYRYQGGIKGEEEYAEMLYITGEPILLKGTVRESTGRSRDGNIMTNISYNLENKEKEIRLTRSLSYVTTKEERDKQEVNTTELERFRESIRIGRDRYNLEEFQFSRSEILDNQPAVTYKSGNWSARKVYSVNRDMATVTVETWGNNVGYDHAWGSQDTAHEEGVVYFDGKVELDRDTSVNTEWSASFSQDLSYNRSRYLEYQENEPTAISFSGGYVDNTYTTESISYEGNFPDLDNGVLASSRWRKLDGSHQIRSIPSKKRLQVANLIDVRGHWAEEDIRKLYGLGAFEKRGNYFHPIAYFFRGQLAKALVSVLDLKLPEPPQEQQRMTLYANYFGNNQKQQEQEEEPLFADVSVDDPNYKYYKAVYEAGVMTGTGPGVFGATKTVTKVQAITILIRALGLEGLAPAGYIYTTFEDDWQIPDWARASVYVAEKIGLIKGDEYGCLRPNDILTRAEAASLLNNFIRFLREEMTVDYRERILNYN